MTGISQKIGGYSLLRKIGSGGYGTVYLAIKDGDNTHYYALKAIEAQKSAREISAFKKYQKLSLSEKSFIAPIIDFGDSDKYFYYVMPLADPLETSQAISPEDPNWEPRTLSNEIRLMSDNPQAKWLSASEILKIMSPIFDGAAYLCNNKLLHRDINPDNILFFNGKARLCDFGLLADDAKSVSSMGTPFFSAPQWYLSSGGNPDIYGIAATFYMLISGNFPDLMGRAAFAFPEKMKDSISNSDKRHWEHWLRYIFRALDQCPNERYIRIEDFKSAVFSEDFESSKNEISKIKKIKIPFRKIFIWSFVAIFAALFLWALPSRTVPIRTIKIDKALYAQIEKNGFKDDALGYKIFSKQEWIANLEEFKRKIIEYSLPSEKIKMREIFFWQELEKPTQR
jgi:chromosome undetermined scaffold_26, whole genome shotgun sequence